MNGQKVPTRNKTMRQSKIFPTPEKDYMERM